MIQLYWLPLIVSTAPMGLMLLTRGIKRTRGLIIGVSVGGMGVTLMLYMGVHTDWSAYRESVEACTRLGCTYFEPSFDYLTYLANVTLGFLLIKLALIFSYWVIIRKLVGRDLTSVEQTIVALSITVAMLPLELGAVRQAIGMAALILAIHAWDDGHRFKSLIWLMLACSFHLSSALVFPAYVITATWLRISSIRISSSIWRISLLLTIAKIISITGISSLVGFFSDNLVTRLGQTTYGTGAIEETGPLRDFLILGERLSICVLAAILLVRSKNKNVHSLAIMSIAGTAIFILFGDIDRNIAGRALASLRIGDVAVLGLGLLTFRPSKRLIANSPQYIHDYGVFIVMVTYVIIKSYFTLVTAGFFDE